MSKRYPIPGYEGYQFEPNTEFVWSTKVYPDGRRIKPVWRITGPAYQLIKYSGYAPDTVALKTIKELVKPLISTATFASISSGSAETGGVVGHDKYAAIIGSIIIENGVVRLSFSNNPHIHTSKASADEELRRLAKMSPGKKYAIWKLSDTLVSGAEQWESFK